MNCNLAVTVTVAITITVTVIVTLTVKASKKPIMETFKMIYFLFFYDHRV